MGGRGALKGGGWFRGGIVLAWRVFSLGEGVEEGVGLAGARLGLWGVVGQRLVWGGGAVVVGGLGGIALLLLGGGEGWLVGLAAPRRWDGVSCGFWGGWGHWGQQRAPLYSLIVSPTPAPHLFWDPKSVKPQAGRAPSFRASFSTSSAGRASSVGAQSSSRRSPFFGEKVGRQGRVWGGWGWGLGGLALGEGVVYWGEGATGAVLLGFIWILGVGQCRGSGDGVVWRHKGLF